MWVAAFSLSFCPLLSSLASLALSRKSDLDVWGALNIVHPGKDEFDPPCITKLYSDHSHACIEGIFNTICALSYYITRTPAHNHAALIERNSITLLTCDNLQMKVLSGFDANLALYPLSHLAVTVIQAGEKPNDWWRLTCHLCSSGRHWRWSWGS